MRDTVSPRLGERMPKRCNFLDRQQERTPALLTTPCSSCMKRRITIGEANQAFRDCRAFGSHVEGSGTDDQSEDSERDRVRLLESRSRVCVRHWMANQRDPEHSPRRC